ncbi:MAG: N-acyl-D-amino-acid deacylase family protein [Burkholderiales bacterium]
MIDLLIRGGVVVDGTGGEPFAADVGVKDGRIVELGRVGRRAHRTLDADGALVLPGFVDIHTHYDGQASWDETFSPSVWHGVTTVVTGNCGVGFAPVRFGDQDRLIALMEGVEEIPGAALAEGIHWNWTSFQGYMEALDAIPHAIDFMTLVPHDCLRLFVMGDRAARGECALAADRDAMAKLLRDALVAGAAGLSIGRTDNHRTREGAPTPGSEADAAELLALADVFRGLPYRVLHAVSDFQCMRGEPAGQRARFAAEYAMLESVARLAARPLALTWLERINAPEQWRWLAERAERSVASGVDVRLQAASRAIGLLNGLDTSFNALVAFPSYRAIAHLPPPERAARMREPEVRERILGEPRTTLSGAGSSVPPRADEILARIDDVSMLMFPFPAGEDDVPDYEPDPRTSFGVRARASGARPLALIYDWLAEGEGTNLVYFPIFNYLRGSLDTVHAMLMHPLALVSLGDAGAHVGTVCDASMPTTLLSHWVRDRRGERIPLPAAISMLSARNARHMGLADRGIVAVGKRADLNLIDPAAIALEPPRLVRDLPAGGRRFVQRARGYLATMVAGVPIVEYGALTGARPGRLVRSATR